MNEVGFLYDAVYLEHDTGSHPENGSRMVATMELLEESGLLSRTQRIDTRRATPDELAYVHEARYVEAVRRAAEEGGGWADPDTLITPRSYDVAAAVVGGTLNALDAVVRGEVRSAYCLVRPPGHHATPVQAMGFCLFNHVAIAARHARRAHGLQRVAVVDFDVHHGNGTQDAFWRDAGVLYVSTHEYPLYPGTGAADEIGEGAGRGFNVNIPMPHGSGDAEHRRAYDEIVAPLLYRYRPDIILVSAGFDAHFADDIAMQQVSVDGYGTLVSIIKRTAEELCAGRMLFAQEGGYHLVALPWCVRRTLEILHGDALTQDPLGTVPAAEPPHFSTIVEQVKQIHQL
jgi:acetoin utilization deacetylase AcuC-like enzyme